MTAIEISYLVLLIGLGKTLIERVLSLLKQPLTARRQAILAARDQKSPRKKRFVEVVGDLLLQRFCKISIRQITAEDQMIARKGWIPYQVVLNQGYLIWEIMGEGKGPALVGAVLLAQMDRHLSKAAGWIVAQQSSFQTTAVTIACQQAQLMI